MINMINLKHFKETIRNITKNILYLIKKLIKKQKIYMRMMVERF
jgi:hypothetical protein